MKKRMKFIFGIHNHQPLGNFDHVIKELTYQCYLPLLEAISERPFFKCCIHISGPLLLWFEKNNTNIIELIGKMIEKGQLEILMGGLYEPVLTSIPSYDRVEQIERMKELIIKLWGVIPRGLWLTERVWESNIVIDLIKAGVSYILVDDRHFLESGFSKKDLHGYFLTEEDGLSISIFPIDENLRYLIPFKWADELEQYFKEIMDEGEFLAIYMDDGEKFGGWPGTKKWVYEDGWLKGFLDKLEDLSLDWLEMLTFSEFIKNFPPKGLCYLPSASYREMEEWALPADKALDIKKLKDELTKKGVKNSPFIRGGHWRNFFVKYPESNWMHKKMVMLSKMASPTSKAKDEILASQCNDAYWHGIFGGLYLPHLRHHIWKHLCAAEAIIRKDQDIVIEEFDLDIDGKKEILVNNENFSLAFSPFRGGHLVEFSYLKGQVNFLNNLTRRKEAYHKKMLENINKTTSSNINSAMSIHDLPHKPAENSISEIIEDTSLREAFIDRIFPIEKNYIDFHLERLDDLTDHRTSSYEYKIYDKKLEFIKKDKIELLEVEIKKLFSFTLTGELNFKYILASYGKGEIPVRFGIEHSIFPPFLAEGRGEIVVNGKKWEINDVSSFNSIKEVKFVGFGDLAILTMIFYQPVDLWIFPVKTVSQSEKGFDLTTQCIAMLFCWPFILKDSAQLGIEGTLKPEGGKNG